MVLSTYRPGSPRLDPPGLVPCTGVLHAAARHHCGCACFEPLGRARVAARPRDLKRLGRSLDPADSIREMPASALRVAGLNRGRVLLFDSRPRHSPFATRTASLAPRCGAVASLRARA